MSRPVCVVAGVGPGNGEAFTRRFAAEGYQVAMLARSEDFLNRLAGEVDLASAFRCDLTDPRAVADVFARVREQLGPVSVLIHNASGFVMKPFAETSPEEFEGQWRLNALTLFLSAQAALPDMMARGQGDIVVIGATASVRGGPLFSAFASSKAAQRLLSESLARQLGPQGIHVSYVVIDGVIDLPRTREWLTDKPDEFFLQPSAIAENVLHLVKQDRSAWTFQLDLRPFGENW